MRNMIFAAAMAGTALTLSACSSGTDEAAAPAAEETGAATDMAADAAPVAVMDANAVTAEQLAAIDGMTPETAEAIVAAQPFASVSDLHAKLMESMTPEQTAAAMEKVFVPINLNSATEDEIRMIPGMTDKMVHEFEEYRPYENIEEFNREIGKYVDEAEVARLRSYVTL